MNLSEITNDSSPSTESQEIKFGLKCSLIAHLFLFLAVLIQSVIFPSKPIPYIPTLRVDLVGLPDLLKNEMKTPTSPALKEEVSKLLKETEQEAVDLKKQAPPKEIAKKEEMTLSKASPKSDVKKLEKKNKSALDRLRSLSKIQDPSPSQVKAPSSSPLIKGNRLSPGTSLSGDAKEGAGSEYYDMIRERLQQHWALPPWIARQKLAAQVQIFIDPKGIVKTYTFVKPSGSPQFDDAIKKTLAESQPFPTPPESFKNSLITQGVLIGFPL